mgnify:CR=1 FL=1
MVRALCAAQRYFEQLKPEESERFLVVAAHQGDRLTVPVGSALGAKLGYQYVPTWNYDFRTVFESVGTGGITATSIRNQIKSAMEEYPAVCGVKAESELDGQTAKIRATVRFQQAGNYKIACVLTEMIFRKLTMKRYPFSTMFCGRHLRIWKVIRSLLPLRKPVSAVSISRSP